MSATVWGNEIDVEISAGIPYRLYRDRPRRLEQLPELADRWGDRPHLVQGENVLTFADVRRAAAAKAAELSRDGVVENDRVVLLGWNSPDWVVSLWAVLELGAVPVLANAWWSEAELADALELLSPKLVLADERGARRLPAATPLGRWGAAPTAAGHVPAVGAHGDEDDTALIIFTSGTSGRPKAVKLSHRSLLAGLQMLLHITKRLPHQIDVATSGEVALHTGPLFHIGGVQTLLRAVCVGDTLVMPAGRFDPAEALRLVEQWGIRRWSAVPTMLTRVLDHDDVHTRDLRTLKALTVGGAPVTAQLLERIRTGLPGVEPRIATGYGLTENGGQAVAASGRDTESRPGTTGRPLPLVEVSTAPPDGFDDGEVLLRSPTQMSGYVGGEPSPIDDEGWLHTGDLGRIDEDGHLWITGRSKDMIIRGGENVAPASVEAALMQVPAVAEAAVFGLPHPELGEEVVAVVVVPEGTTEESLVDGLRGRLASFAVPSRWTLRHETLPTNHAGKVDKPALVAAARIELTSAR